MDTYETQLLTFVAIGMLLYIMLLAGSAFALILF